MKNITEPPSPIFLCKNPIVTYSKKTNTPISVMMAAACQRWLLLWPIQHDHDISINAISSTGVSSIDACADALASQSVARRTHSSCWKLSWKCRRHVGNILATHDIVGRFWRHGLSLPTRCRHVLWVESVPPCRRAINESAWRETSCARTTRTQPWPPSCTSALSTIERWMPLFF